MTFKEKMKREAMKALKKDEIIEFTLLIQAKDGKHEQIIRGPVLDLMIALSISVEKIADECNAEVSEVLEEIASLCKSKKNIESKIKNDEKEN